MRTTAPTALPPLPRLTFVPSSKSNPHESNPTKQVKSTSPPSIPDQPPPKITLLPPSHLSFPHASPHGPGLNNQGNTCYANSVLQSLLHLPALHHLFLSHSPSPSPSSRAHNTSLACALCALRQLSRSVHSLPGGGDASGPRRRGALSPALLSPRGLRALSPAFRSYQQQDAHEFLCALLEAAMRADVLGCLARPFAAGGEAVPRPREMRGAVHRAVGGLLQSGVVCGECGYESVTREPFLHLSLPLAAGGVEACVKRFFVRERLVAGVKYRCEKCCKPVVAEKRMSVATAPNCLTLHLKRFDGLRKDRRDVRYGARFSLAPYMLSRGAGKGAGVAEVTAKANGVDAADAGIDASRVDGLTYALTAVVVHDGGSCRSGHYYAYVKGSNGTWALKNDEMSRLVNEAQVLSQKQAYLLFYTRIPAANEAKECAKAAAEAAEAAGLQAQEAAAAAASNTVNAAEDSNASTQDAEATSEESSDEEPQDAQRVAPLPRRLSSSAAPDAALPVVGSRVEQPSIYSQKVEGGQGTRSGGRFAPVAVPPPCASPTLPRLSTASPAVDEQQSGPKESDEPLVRKAREEARIELNLATSRESERGDESEKTGADCGISQPNPSPDSQAAIGGDEGNEEESAVQAFMTGGGRVVRKLAQRILNACVGTQAAVSTVGVSSNAVATAASAAAMVAATAASRGPPAVTAGVLSPPTRETPQAPPPPPPTPTKPQAAYLEGAGSLRRERVRDKDSRSRVSAADTLGRGGVVRWDMNAELGKVDVAEPELKTLKKRERARDAADADYDRGKPKKVRRKSHSSSCGVGGSPAANPFQTVQGRREMASPVSSAPVVSATGPAPSAHSR